MELLIEMGVLKQCLRDEMSSNGESGADLNEKAEKGSRKHDSPVNDQDPRYDPDSRNWTAHALMMNGVLRVIKHLGCPHGCAEGVRGPQAEFCRSQAHTIVTKLHRASPKLFTRWLRNMVRDQPLGEIIDVFHAFLGFCIDPSMLLFYLVFIFNVF